MSNINIYSMTPSQYLALTTKDIDSLYFLSNGQLYKGDMLLNNKAVLIPNGEDYPVTGVDNTFYAKESGECALWNGTDYTIISNSAITELEDLEDRINSHASFAAGGVGIIQKTIRNIESINVTNIGDYAFYNSSNLQSVSLPNATSIGVSVFDGCGNLITVNLSSVTKINLNDFRNCSSLPSITLPNVTDIGASAFLSCTSLTTIVLSKNHVASLINNAFNSTPIKTGTGYIYVPDDLVDSYKAATSWKTYADMIKGISELPSNNGGE